MNLGALVAALRHPQLLAEAPALPAGVADLRAGGLAYDSRRVTAGSVFVAVRGEHVDGTVFAPQAVARGAAVVVSEAAAPAGITVPWITVPDARLGLALLADRLYGEPSRSLDVIGITGTNGKTTTAFLLRAIFEAAGRPCGLIGTVAYVIGGDERPATRTTPEAPELQALLRDMVDRGTRAAMMEVSSHALVLRRVDGVRFAAGVFTNLTRDHLDFHRDMQEYARAKRRLFELLPDGAPGIVNADDARAALFVEAAGRPITYAMKRAADVSAGRLSLTLDGLDFDVSSPAGPLRIRSSLVGQPNVYNILASVATAIALGIPREAIEAGIATLPGVPGRFEVVSGVRDDVTVVVDYAHTDDALRNVLETARDLRPERLITVFGCGGDRDRTKRPLMGAVAGRLSDVVIVTSDNPRSEEPAAIIDEILRGVPASAQRTVQSGDERRTVRGPEVSTIVDRRAAIEQAIGGAWPGDLVVIAGKGHEKYQQIGDRVLPFDDVQIARAALENRRSRSRVR